MVMVYYYIPLWKYLEWSIWVAEVVNAPDLGSRGPGLESCWRRNSAHDCTVFHCTKPFISGCKKPNHYQMFESQHIGWVPLGWSLTVQSTWQHVRIGCLSDRDCIEMIQHNVCYCFCGEKQTKKALSWRPMLQIKEKKKQHVNFLS